MKTDAGVKQFEAIANDISDLVLEFGGALSGEHGDGLVRSPFMEKMFGPALYDAFRTIKQTFDPHGLFNPGKIVDCPSHHVQPALRIEVRRSQSGHVLRLRGWRRRRRDRDVQRTGRLPQDARRDDVPVVHGDARRAALDARTGQRPSLDHRGTTWRVRAWRSAASTSRSTSASNAAHARPNVLSVSTSPASRASSSPTTGSVTVRRSKRACSATCRRSPRGAAGSHRSRTGSPPAARRAASTSDSSASIDRRRLPQFKRRTLRRRAPRRQRAMSTPSCSTTRSRTTTTRRLGSPRSA